MPPRQSHSETARQAEQDVLGLNALSANKLLLQETREKYNIEVPPKKSNKDYYNEYTQLFVYNFVLTAHAKELYQEQKSLMKKYHMLTVRVED